MRAALALVALLVCSLLSVESASAASSTCGGSGELGDAHVHCIKNGHETQAYVAHHSDHTYSIRPACEIGGTALCSKGATCTGDGPDSRLYNVYRDDETEPLPWQACLTDDEANHLGGVTPAMVQHAFKRLTWPSSPLVVQPPGGRTLVNFDTNFYTTNDHPTSQVVTLLGQRITIEATPVSYVWRFGEGEARATDDPGAAYPDLRITYRYERAATVSPSVDTTYHGRYRIGSGPWRDIPTTLTVPGDPASLRVLTATPHLVSY